MAVGARRRLRLLFLFVLGLAAIVTGADRATWAATPGPTPVCDSLPAGDVTWSAVGSPYLLCPDGAYVPPSTRLTIDAASGPVVVRALGQGGITNDGEILTKSTTASRTVTFTSISATAGSWEGIGNGGKVTLADSTVEYPVTGIRSGTVDLSRTTIQYATQGGVVAARSLRFIGGTVRSTGESVGDDFDVSGVSGTLGPFLVSGVSFSDLPREAVRYSGVSAGPVSIIGNEMTRTGASGTPAISVDGTLAFERIRPVVQDNVVRSTTAPQPVQRQAAVVLRRVDVDLTTDVARNTGIGNAIEAVLLDESRAVTDFSWRTPTTPTLVPGPLGYLLTSLYVDGAVMTVPTNGVVKAAGGTIELRRGHLAASNGAIFTSIDDESAGVSVCPSALSSTCTPRPGSWRGIYARGATSTTRAVVFLDRASARFAETVVDVAPLGSEALPAGPTTVDLTGSTIERSMRGVVVQGPSLAMASTTVRQLAGGVSASNVSFLGRGVDVQVGRFSAAGLTVEDTTAEAIRTDGGAVSAPNLRLSRTGTAGTPALRTVNPTTLDLSQSRVVASGTGGARAPAIVVAGSRGDLTQSLLGVRGSGNGVDAVELQDVSVDSDLTWLPVQSSNVEHPLGYISGGVELLAGRTLRVPAATTVVGYGGLKFTGGRLDASAGGATFTAIGDPIGGIGACPPGDARTPHITLSAACVGPSARWPGITIQHAPSGARGTAHLRNAFLLRASVGIEASTTATSSVSDPNYGVVLDGVTVEDSGGLYSGGAALSVRGSTFRRVYNYAVAATALTRVTLVDNLVEDVEAGGTAFAVVGQRLPAAAVTIERNRITRLSGWGIDVARVIDPLIRDNSFTEVGPTAQVHLLETTVDASRLTGNTSRGAQLDAFLFDDVSWAAAGSWRPLGPVSPTEARPLGHLIGRGPVRIVPGGTLTLPAAAVVKSVNGALSIEGGRLDATAGGVVLTSAGDSTVGADACGSVPCTSTRWQGINAQASTGGISTGALVGAEVRAAVDGIVVRGGAGVAPAITWQGGRLTGRDRAAVVLGGSLTLSGVTVSAAGNGVVADGGSTAVTCSSLVGNGIGILVTTGQLSVNDSNLTGNTHTEVRAVPPVDARRNWWGRPGGPPPGETEGPVDFSEPRSTRSTCAPGYDAAYDNPVTPPTTTTTTTAPPPSTTTTTTTSRPTTTTTRQQAQPQPQPPAAPIRSGYWMIDEGGNVYSFGDAPGLGSAPVGSSAAVDLEPTPSGQGYWIVDALGRVFSFGDAPFLGGGPLLGRAESVTAVSSTRSGRGYWLFTSTGRVLTYGDAPHLGDMSGTKLNGPVLDSIPTPTGQGYYMVASDGGIFTFGDAVFRGSMGSARLNQPVQSLVPDDDSVGYWLVASDGGIFAFDAEFYGSMGDTRLNRPVTGMVGSRRGYLMVAEDGGIFTFGEAAFHGSLGAQPPARPVTSVAPLPG